MKLASYLLTRHVIAVEGQEAIKCFFKKFFVVNGHNRS